MLSTKGAVMLIAELIGQSVRLACPPPGSLIVRRLETVEGPGGRWVPCVIVAPGEVHFAGLFQVGPGCRHVCAVDRPMKDIDEALALAAELAATAAG